MTEMTAAEATSILTIRNYTFRNKEYCALPAEVAEKMSRLFQQQAAIIEAQAREIKRLHLYRGCLDCRFNDSGVINNYLCHGRNCVDFDNWRVKEGQ